MGRGWCANDAGLFPPDGVRRPALTPADLHQLSAKPVMGLSHDVLPYHRSVVDHWPGAPGGSAGLPTYSGMVGIDAGNHLSRARTGRSSARAALRAGDTLVATLD